MPSGVFLVAILGLKSVIAIQTSKNIVTGLVFVAQLFVAYVFVHNFIHNIITIDMLDFVVVFNNRKAVVFVDYSVEAYWAIAAGYVYNCFIFGGF